MLIASGTGESKLPADIASVARNRDARLGLMTSARESTIKSTSDAVVRPPGPTKNDTPAGIALIQFMGTLSDKSLRLFGDIVGMAIQGCKDLSSQDLWIHHANPEWQVTSQAAYGT